MAGVQNVTACVETEYLIGWGLRKDDGTVDLSSRFVRSVEATVTLAQINSGYVLLPAVTGRQYQPLGVLLHFNGTFTGATDIRVEGTDGTNLIAIAIAGATNGARYNEVSSGTNVTQGAAMATVGGLAAGVGIRVAKTGSPAAGGTSVYVRLLYRIIS